MAVPAAGEQLNEAEEALRRVVESQIGPRQVGAVYQNVDGAFEVLDVVLDPRRARELLGRRSALWAVVVKDLLRKGAEPFVVGSVWTSADELVVAAAGAGDGAR
jgi:hypothetical protein